MMTFLDPLFWLYFIYFIIVVVFAFFIPGDVLLKPLKLKLFERITISIILGFVVWSLQGFLFGYLDIRWMSYLYISIFTIIWVREHFIRKANYIGYIKNEIKRIDKVLIFLVVLGTIIQFISIGFNGIYYSNALHFCCGTPDTLYHMALSDAIVKHMPPFEPGMEGVSVKNYHYLSNVVVADLVRVFNLPLLFTQNQFLSLLISLLIGCSGIAFAQSLQAPKNFTRWLVFFLYFTGDFIFLISFLLGNGWNFSGTLLENAATLWISPPRVYAITIFFAASALLVYWIKRKDIYTGILLSIMIGSLMGFKVYIGIFTLFGLGCVGLYYLFNRDFRMVIPLLLAPLISLAVYLPVNKGAGGIFFAGLWRFEDFIASPTLGLSEWELRRRIYVEHKNWLRLLQYEIQYIILYILSAGGVFLLGFFQTKKSLSLFPKQIHIFFLSSLFLGLTLGLFFLQDVGGANTSQFLIAVNIIGPLYLALFCYFMSSKIHNYSKFIFLLLIIALTIPRIIQVTYGNIYRIFYTDVITLDKSELQIFNYISNNTSASSVIFIADKDLTFSNDSYYFPLLTHRDVFLAGEGILRDHGVFTQKHIQILNGIVLASESAKVGKTILKTDIDYIFLPAKSVIISTRSADFLPIVFENKSGKVLELDRKEAQRHKEKK